MADDRADSDIQRLVREQLDSVYRYAYRLTGSVPDAEDLTQQTFLLAKQRLEQLREPEKARGWLFAIVRNCFLRSVERQQPMAASDVGLDLEMVPEGAESGSRVDSAELQAAIDRLPPDFRLVVVMFYFEDCSYRQIAEKLELPIGTVMSRLARAKKQLRDGLFEGERAGKVLRAR